MTQVIKNKGSSDPYNKINLTKLQKGKIINLFIKHHWKTSVALELGFSARTLDNIAKRDKDVKHLVAEGSEMGKASYIKYHTESSKNPRDMPSNPGIAKFLMSANCGLAERTQQDVNNQVSLAITEIDVPGNGR